MHQPPDLLDPNNDEHRAALLAWLRLQSELGLKPQLAVELLDREGEQALRPGSRREEAAISALRRCNAIALPLLSPAYPERLRALSDAAPLLFIQGNTSVLDRTTVAIVGARAASAGGLRAAREFARDVASTGVVIVSGLARGIDAAAHEGALEAGGQTVAVQACGPDRVYPREHRNLAERIVQKGAVVSELPPGTRPKPAFFPLRNRLISGLAKVVVVVEARKRSGSLITARHAADQGRDVMAVPGALAAPTSEGSNELIRDGAKAALGADDILHMLGLPPHRRRRRKQPEVSREGRDILETLVREPLTRDQLGRALGRAPESLALELLQLELEGRVAEDRDGRLRLTRSSGE